MFPLDIYNSLVFELIIFLNIKLTNFWWMTPRIVLGTYQRFGVTCRLRFQGGRCLFYKG